MNIAANASSSKTGNDDPHKENAADGKSKNENKDEGFEHLWCPPCFISENR